MSHRAVGTITAVVVDDEKLARDELCFLLKSFPEIEVVGSGENGFQVLELIERCDPDLVFLDVQMPGLDGLSAIQRLREDGTALPHFILVTAYENYAIAAFRMEAFDYLLKPVERERLAETIQRVLRGFQERS